MEKAAQLLGIVPTSRIECVIDGNQLYSMARGLNFDVDYANLRNILRDTYNLRRISYITRVLYNASGEIARPTVARLLDFLRYNGYSLIQCEQEEHFDETTNRRVFSRDNMEVLMALALMQASNRRIDELLLISESSELIPVIHECQQRGARVTLIASRTVTKDLLGEVDHFIDLQQLMPFITRSLDEERAGINRAIAAEYSDEESRPLTATARGIPPRVAKPIDS